MAKKDKAKDTEEQEISELPSSSAESTEPIEPTDNTTPVEPPIESTDDAPPVDDEPEPESESEEIVERPTTFFEIVNAKALGQITEHLNGAKYIGVSVPFDGNPVSISSGQQLTSAGTSFTPLHQVEYQAGLVCKDPVTGELFHTPTSTLMSEEAWLKLECPSGAGFIESHRFIE